MTKKQKKFLALLLTFIMLLGLNVTAFAAEAGTKNTYQVTIGEQVFDLTEGSYLEVPMQPIAIEKGSSDTVVGTAGTLTVWGSGHYLYWNIIMTLPATSFTGSVKSTDIKTGLSSGYTRISGFSGKVYAARISGHTYTATLVGTALFGTKPVATTRSNRVTWVP